MFQKAEKVFKEKEKEWDKGRCHQAFRHEPCVDNLGR